VARRVTVDIGNIYDQPAGDHQLLVMSSALQPGDSGSPVVNTAGQVVGVAFASSTFAPSTAFAVASEELAPVLAQSRAATVSTGPCLDEG
jgi:S1-C subfamily serine protease